MTWLGKLPRLYADTSLFCRIDETLGWTGLLACLDYFDDALRIVVDVNRELRGHAQGRFPNLKIMQTHPMQGQFLRDRAVVLEPEDALRVAQVASTFPDADPLSRGKNHGEVATVLQAKRENVPAIIDDVNGISWAHEQGVHTYTTRHVAVEMFDAGRLTRPQAQLLWDRVYGYDKGALPFDQALAALRADGAE